MGKNEKKMIFSDFFPAAKKIMEKKYIFDVHNRFWATAQFILWRRKFLYCNLGFVLQERGLEKNYSENCIAIQFLYCREEGLSSLNCIAGIV